MSLDRRSLSDTSRRAKPRRSYDERSATAVAFDRSVEGRSLSFAVEAAVQGDLLVADAGTGTIWSGLTGRALSGPLAGTEPRQLPATYAFWFAWSDFYTQTELFQP